MPWRPLGAGVVVGLALLVLTQLLSSIPIVVGPWALNGNGALAVPSVGIPLAVYAGWTWLGQREDPAETAIRLGAYGLGLVVGLTILGLFFGLPVVLLTAAVYAALVRGPRRPDWLLWAIFAVAAIVAALPVVGIFGIGLLPGSLIVLAQRRSTTGERVAVGAVLALALVAVVFIAPIAIYPRFGLVGPGSP